jgi:sensor c-di-GMP phosphodiesterase-like protein
LPSDILKVDKSFVDGLGETVEDMALVQLIVDTAHTLGMHVVAEGVESAKQVEQLREMGCDAAQGHHFSEPLPPEAASNFLRDRGSGWGGQGDNATGARLSVIATRYCRDEERRARLTAHTPKGS